MPEKGTRSIVESWPSIRDDFEAFTRDPTCWFIDHVDAALAEENLDEIRKLIEIFKVVNAPSDGHSH